MNTYTQPGQTAAGYAISAPPPPPSSLWEITQNNARKVAELEQRLEMLRAHFVGNRPVPDQISAKNAEIPSHTALVAMTGDELTRCDDILTEIFQIIGI